MGRWLRCCRFGRSGCRGVGKVRVCVDMKGYQGHGYGGQGGTWALYVRVVGEDCGIADGG